MEQAQNMDELIPFPKYSVSSPQNLLQALALNL